MSAPKRARRAGRKLALVAALVTCAVQAAAMGWRQPGPLLFALLLSLAASEVASAATSPRFGWIAGLLVGLMPVTLHAAATADASLPVVAGFAVVWAFGVNAARGSARAPFAAGAAAMGLAGAATGYVVAIVGAAPSSGAGEPATSGALAQLQSIADRFLVAGGLVAASGLLLLLVNVGARRRWRALALLAPAVGWLAFVVARGGGVELRTFLPLCLTGAVAMTWALANAAGAAGGRRRRVWLGGLVALWALGEASGVIEAGWSDVRPASVARLETLRRPGDEIWICADPIALAPLPAIAQPSRVLTLREIEQALGRGEPRPRFLWLAVDRRTPLAAKAALERLARERLGMRLVELFESSPRAPIAADPGGLLLPTVALFEPEPR